MSITKEEEGERERKGEREEGWEREGGEGDKKEKASQHKTEWEDQDSLLSLTPREKSE